MKHKNIFLDEIYLFACWPNILGFIYQNIITLVVVISILGTNGPLTVVLDMLLTKTNQLIFFAILFSIFALFGFAFGFVARGNPLLIPVTPIASLRQIKKYQNTVDRKEDRFFKYMLPFLTFLVYSFFFLVSYASGEEWQEALSMAAWAILPFHVGFLALHVVSIGLETVLLLLRYVIHHN